MQAARYVRRSRQTTSTDLCTTFCTLFISVRGLGTTAIHRATGGSNNATPNPQHSATPEAHKRNDVPAPNKLGRSPNAMPSNPALNTVAEPADKTVAAYQRTKEIMAEERAKGQNAPKPGGLASNSIFADEFLPIQKDDGTEGAAESTITALMGRSPQQMAARIDPNPGARVRWQRKMVIRNIRRSGRPTREVLLARIERTHTSKSHFFKTSVKKLAPLARQIAGKSIDEAILQMRFSSKKAAADVQKHLIQARNEAIVMRGMGLPPLGAARITVEPLERDVSTEAVQKRIMEAIQDKEIPKGAALQTSAEQPPHLTLTQSSAVADRQGAEITTPAETAPLPSQNPTKSLRKGVSANPTDIYIAQAWVNRGKYAFAANHRARGRIDKLRLPYTGISVLLQEEQTRTRQKVEKEMKSIRKRLNGKVWTQLPDRPIVRQSQYVLW